jgi:hypothetical protein
LRDKDYFAKELLRVKLKPEPGYGGNVLPALQIFAGLSSFEERKAFQDALEDLLQSKIADDRRFAVTVCLGFLVFRDTLKTAGT